MDKETEKEFLKLLGSTEGKEKLGRVMSAPI
jgi:hypothetical protein